MIANEGNRIQERSDLNSVFKAKDGKSERRKKIDDDDRGWNGEGRKERARRNQGRELSQVVGCNFPGEGLMHFGAIWGDLGHDLQGIDWL